MKAESMQLFMIPITKTYHGVPFAPNRGDASQMVMLERKQTLLVSLWDPLNFTFSHIQVKKIEGRGS